MTVGALIQFISGVACGVVLVLAVAAVAAYRTPAWPRRPLTGSRPGGAPIAKGGRNDGPSRVTIRPTSPAPIRRGGR